MSETTQRAGSPSAHYRDVFWAILFLGQLMVVMASAFVLGFPAIQRSSSTFEYDEDIGSASIQQSLQSALMYSVGALGVAIVSSFLCLTVMAKYSDMIVVMAFGSTPAAAVVAAATSTYFFGLSQSIFIWYFAAGTTVLALITYWWVNRYIPLASSTLQTTMAALATHWGVFILAAVTTVLVFAWTCVWVMAAYGVQDYYQQLEPLPVEQVACPDNPHRLCTIQPTRNVQVTAVSIAMLLSLFWGHQVLGNILHATVAGTVGSWWFISSPGDEKTALRHSLYRACTLSFGSICLGSLIVAVVATLEQVVAMMAKRESERREREQRERNNYRRQRETGGGYSFLQQILNWLKQITEYINAWAFCYVGIYGFDYMNAGKTVAKLFKDRGWSTFVSDRLVFRAIGLAKLSIAILTGAILSLNGAASTVLWSSASVFSETSFVLDFFLGALLGGLLANTALSPVESGVRTVMVCFAENGSALERHRPQLHKAMTQGWSSAYPNAWREQHRY